jgi:hypothetical protein
MKCPNCAAPRTVEQCDYCGDGRENRRIDPKDLEWMREWEMASFRILEHNRDAYAREAARRGLLGRAMCYPFTWV